MSNTIKIEIKTSSKEQSEILIAELSEINFDAFEDNESSLSAFINEEKFNEEELNKLILKRNITYTKSVIAQTNWNAKWESEFEPVIVDDFVAVRAGFHQPIKNVAHEIIITPKMSFGTGHHATTFLMLQQMQKMNFKNKIVLDFGTGTGVLAILAKKSGAKKVVAIDNDEWSINNAKENFTNNKCDDIELFAKDNLNPDNYREQKFDTILANINLNVIVSNIQWLKNICNSSAQLLISGFLKSDEEAIIKKFEKFNFKNIEVTQKGEWIAMLITMP